MVVMARASEALGFSREDRIAAMFCGSKKTLASGVPMAKLIFGAHPGLGLILLPIMIYHPLQLVVCGLLAQRWGRQPASSP
jgi:sodium/bile acid cotransporter 7